ncbi:MAG: LSU ribosomal protein L30p (L7e), partial [uncultured Sphingomonas sp.]
WRPSRSPRPDRRSAVTRPSARPWSGWGSTSCTARSKWRKPPRSSAKSAKCSTWCQSSA